MSLEQVQLDGGPCDGWWHVVTESQGMATFADKIDGKWGVLCYARSASPVPGVFGYDGFEPI